VPQAKFHIQLVEGSQEINKFFANAKIVLRESKDICKLRNLKRGGYARSAPPTMTSTASWIKRVRMEEDALREIYASDQEMYPVPLPYERLRAWVEKASDLCLCFEVTNEIGRATSKRVGSLLVLPLMGKYWQDLLAGRLRETDINVDMFPTRADDDVGLHVFHIERSETFRQLGRLKYFAEFALENAREVTAKKCWKITGYSGANLIIPNPAQV
jgi:hypothetical protein